MYKLTECGSTDAIYDYQEHPLPEGEVYFHTHQMLWKDDILLGRVYIGSDSVKLMLTDVLTIPRNEFQKLFMEDTQIVNLIFHAKEVNRVELHLTSHANSCPHMVKNSRSIQLSNKNPAHVWGYLYYWLK